VNEVLPRRADDDRPRLGPLSFDEIDHHVFDAAAPVLLGVDQFDRPIADSEIRTARRLPRDQEMVAAGPFQRDPQVASTGRASSDEVLAVLRCQRRELGDDRRLRRSRCQRADEDAGVDADDVLRREGIDARTKGVRHQAPADASTPEIGLLKRVIDCLSLHRSRREVDPHDPAGRTRHALFSLPDGRTAILSSLGPFS